MQLLQPKATRIKNCVIIQQSRFSNLLIYYVKMPETRLNSELRAFLFFTCCTGDGSLCNCPMCTPIILFIVIIRYCINAVNINFCKVAFDIVFINIYVKGFLFLFACREVFVGCFNAETVYFSVKISCVFILEISMTYI